MSETDVVLFGNQVYAGHEWPPELTHRGPVRTIEKPEVAEIKERVPPELRNPAMTYTFGAGFKHPEELLKHVDVNANWTIVRVDFFLLFRLAVGHVYTLPAGYGAAKAVDEYRAASLTEMRRMVARAFPGIELPEVRGVPRVKMAGFPIADFSQLNGPTKRPSECRKVRCADTAENPAYGGVLCTGCRKNELQHGIDTGTVLDVNNPPLVATMAKPGWALGLCGYPGVWFPQSIGGKKVEWADCVARGRFLASGLVLDEMAWIFTTSRNRIDLSVFRFLIPDDGTAIARISETGRAVGAALRLDRGPANAIRICEALRRVGVAQGPMLLNVDNRPDQTRLAMGIFNLRERAPGLHAGGITIMQLPALGSGNPRDKTPVVVMSHAAAALARLLNKDSRGMPLSYSVYEGRVPPPVPDGAIRIDAGVGFEGLKVLDKLTSDAVAYVENAHALTFGMLYRLAQTPASIVFCGSAIGKYGFTHATFRCDLGQAWYCVVAAAADPGSNGTLVTTGTVDYEDAPLRAMLSMAQIGPCAVCEKDEGRDHISDLILAHNAGVEPKWKCSAESVLGRSLEQARAEAEAAYDLLRRVATETFE